MIVLVIAVGFVVFAGALIGECAYVLVRARRMGMVRSATPRASAELLGYLAVLALCVAATLLAVGVFA